MVKCFSVSDNFDPSGNSYDYADFQRAILGICHSLVFCDEHFQVNGVNFLMDYGSITMKHITFGGSENMKKRAQHFQVDFADFFSMFHKPLLKIRACNLIKLLRMFENIWKSKRISYRCNERSTCLIINKLIHHLL